MKFIKFINRHQELILITMLGFSMTFCYLAFAW